MNKRIMMNLKTPVGLIEIGRIDLETEVMNAFGYTMRDNHIQINEIVSLSAELWASAKVICEGWVYLYHVVIYDKSANKETDMYYYVSSGALYENNRYHKSIEVGEQIICDNSIEVLRIFCNKAIEELERG
jgi:hypothetical protein